MRLLALALLLATACASSCRERSAAPERTGPRPSILLVTLDTTRADAVGPEAAVVETPAFSALASRGLRFRHAYATRPRRCRRTAR